MPNNRRIAEQRALNLRRRFNGDASFHVDYTVFMDDIISKGYAQRVPAEHLECSDGRVWYLPHHGVSHPKKKKIRVVFDCAATFQGTSLNDQLLQGPDFTSTLTGVMTRFRKEPIAITVDIEAMFHQVKVPPEDSDLLRFLWWPSGVYSPVEFTVSQKREHLANLIESNRHNPRVLFTTIDTVLNAPQPVCTETSPDMCNRFLNFFIDKVATARALISAPVPTLSPALLRLRSLSRCLYCF